MYFIASKVKGEPHTGIELGVTVSVAKISHFSILVENSLDLARV